MKSFEDLTLVLIGAANRVEFIDLAESAASNLGIDLRLISVELNERVPIASKASVVTTPLQFGSMEFAEFLTNRFRGANFLVLPFMDSSVRRVYEAKSNFKSPVSEDSVRVLNKSYLKALCEKVSIPVPRNVSSGSAHVRPIFGNGGVGVSKTHLSGLESLNHEAFLYEELLTGPEVSLDVYVFLDGTYSAIARDRLRIVGGEVQHTHTRDTSEIEREVLEKLLSSLALRGPLNIQLMGEEPRLLEINPRFGGGSTASIHAGWSAPNWLIQEYLLGRTPSEIRPAFKHVEVIRAWKDYIWR